MIFAFWSLMAGCISAAVSIGFRLYEIRSENIFLGKQFLSQIALFGVISYIFSQNFSQYSLNIGGLELGWFFIFFVFSSVSYYMTQIVFEHMSRISLFPTEKEIEEFMEKRMQ